MRTPRRGTGVWYRGGMLRSSRDEEPPLGAVVLAVAERLRERLIAGLIARGWPELSANELLVFLLLPWKGIRPPALAEQVGITRQSLHTLLGRLEDRGLIAVDPELLCSRRTWVRLTERGVELVADGREVLDELDGELRRALEPRPGRPQGPRSDSQQSA
jgi:DNA-binding MarR family transcriptional regulator